MPCTKTYMHILAIIILTLSPIGLVAMKIPNKILEKAQSGFIMPQRPREEGENYFDISQLDLQPNEYLGFNSKTSKETKKIKNNKVTEEIKNHTLEITKNPKFQNAPDFIIPESIKIFNTPYFLELPLLIDENTMAFVDDIDNKIQILDIQTGNSIKTIETGTSAPTVMIRWGKNFIVSGDHEGNIKILDITKNPSNACINTINVATKPILGLKNIAENIFIFYSLSARFDDPKFNDKIFDEPKDTLVVTKFLNLENIDNPHLFASEGFSKNRGSCNGVESAENGNGIWWDVQGNISLLNKENVHNHGFFRTNPGLSALKKISKETCILGFMDGKTQIYDLKTEKIHKRSMVGHFWNDSPINCRVIDFLELPHNNGIICITPELIKFLNPETANWTHQIDCHNFFKQTKDSISSVFYAANKIFVVTEKGCIITCNCATKDINYLFQNLNISKNKKSFKDLGFKFKYNYDTEN